MSLFVGNVSRNVNEKELETEFIEFGSCKVEKKVFIWKLIVQGNYAFVDFDHEDDADEAKRVMQGKEMGGLCINIEWSKRSGRYDPKEAKSRLRILSNFQKIQKLFQ